MLENMNLSSEGAHKGPNTMKGGNSTTRHLIVKFQKYKHKRENPKSFQKHISSKRMRIRLTSHQSYQLVEDHGAIPSKL